MAVYVDDANIPATVRNGPRTHTSAWCHLTADTQEELHAFAARLGLKRSYFQPGRPIAGKPSPFWHYDVTAGLRARAVALGALEVPARELPGICRARGERGEPRPGRASDPQASPVEREQGCSFPRCGTVPARPYMTGPRCDSHKPLQQATPAREAPPSSVLAFCTSCGTARLTHGQAECQACGAARQYQPAGHEYRDLSHGSPGHMCVQPNPQAQIEPPCARPGGSLGQPPARSTDAHAGSREGGRTVTTDGERLEAARQARMSGARQFARERGLSREGRRFTGRRGLAGSVGEPRPARQVPDDSATGVGCGDHAASGPRPGSRVGCQRLPQYCGADGGTGQRACGSALAR